MPIPKRKKDGYGEVVQRSLSSSVLLRHAERSEASQKSRFFGLRMTQIGKLETAILLEEEIYLSVKVLGESSYTRLRQYHSPFLMNVECEGIAL